MYTGSMAVKNSMDIINISCTEIRLWVGSLN